jgi:hypothetical protein
MFRIPPAAREKTPGNAANVDLFFRFDSAGGRGDNVFLWE